MKIKVIGLILVLSVVLVCFHCQKDTPADIAAEKEDAYTPAGGEGQGLSPGNATSPLGNIFMNHKRIEGWSKSRYDGLM
mgnify:CR=1 FL=1